MESEVGDDYQNVCRLCDRNATKMFSVFEKNPDGYQIIHLIRQCLPMIIYRTDPLSKQVCEGCVEHLNLFFNFRKDTLQVIEKQKERLKSRTQRQGVQLFLSSLDSDDENDNLENGTDNPTNAKHVDRTTSPLENGHVTSLCINCKTFAAEPEGNEIEMCAELHKAIAESLKKNISEGVERGESHALALRNKRKRNEGFYTELEVSQDSSVTTDFTYTESVQNTESQSDMEMCDSDRENVHEVVAPPAKRRRLAGPKSYHKHCENISIQKATTMEPTTVYNPFTLLRIALDSINRENIPDFHAPVCDESVLKSECKYCSAAFENIKQLAVHEAGHINIEMGVRIDDPAPWDRFRDDAGLRNKWLEDMQMQVEEDEEEPEEAAITENGDGDLLVPISSSVQAEPPEPGVKGEVVLIDGKPTVNGIPLAELPKEERRTIYRNITIGGLKRKFCPLCRYTFKDNWAIESHYFSSSCHYTCKFCGIRFNKQRYQFDEHVKQHQAKGELISSKVFAPRKWHGSLPKVISETKLKPRTPPKPLLRPSVPEKVIKPLKMKHLLERKTLQANLRVNNDVGSSGATPSNQAYFCRKCYQVFFKLDEFNIHVTTCTGNQHHQQIQQTPQNHNAHTPVKGITSSSASNTGSVNSDNENFSPSGRPMRHCVREVGTYKDEFKYEDYKEREIKVEKGAHLKSERGFECGLCNSAFPTVHSRNSHMRIHKNGDAISRNSNNYVAKNVSMQYTNQYMTRDVPTYSNYVGETQIKQEPLEPIVEINENPHNFPSSIGSVSITPIPKSNVNPNIMKLVQNNPHLTIKSMGNNHHNALSPPASSSSPVDPDRTYKCANCSRTFANKSHLYFHKKNQCGGSKYPCPFCKKRFGTEAAYSSHIFYSHPE